MKVRALATVAACAGTLALAQMTPSFADGMPEDDNYNPVPSVPGVPAPGVTQPPPIKPVPPEVPPAQPAPAKTAPTPEPAPAVPATPPATVSPPAATAPAPAPSTSPLVTKPSASAAPAAPAAAPSVSASAQRTLYEVLSVNVAVSPKNPAEATITVKGTARTGGWKNIELRPLQTFAPEVGMRSFTLVGTVPDGFSTQALSPVSTTITIEQLPTDVRTIRVLSESNEMAQTFR